MFSVVGVHSIFQKHHTADTYDIKRFDQQNQKFAIYYTNMQEQSFFPNWVYQTILKFALVQIFNTSKKSLLRKAVQNIFQIVFEIS